MRIAILSDSPALSTGFARTTRHFADALTEMNHEVVCFGVGSWGDNKDFSNFNYKIWSTGEENEDHRSKFIKFIKIIEPSVLLINYDLITAVSWIDFIRSTSLNVRIILHLVIDGLPVYPGVLRSLSHCSAIIVPLNCVYNFLTSYISIPIYTFPHLVDENIFFKSDFALKDKASLGFSRYCLGIFAQNRPRKQIIQVIQAVKLLRNENYDCSLLIHTDHRNASWRNGDNLDQIIKYYDLEANCFITDSTNLSTFSESKKTAAFEGDRYKNKQTFIDKLTISERINFCDVITIPSAYGGFEYSIIESQACGIPICSTNDRSILTEVAGEGSLLLEPSLYDFTSYGAKSFRIAPGIIAGAVAQLIDDQTLRRNIVDGGIKNVKKYSKEINFPLLKEVLNSIL